jgi:hypothetical protein
VDYDPATKEARGNDGAGAHEGNDDREEAMPTREEPEGESEEANGEDDRRFPKSPKRRRAENN